MGLYMQNFNINGFFQWQIFLEVLVFEYFIGFRVKVEGVEIRSNGKEGYQGVKEIFYVSFISKIVAVLEGGVVVWEVSWQVRLDICVSFIVEIFFFTVLFYRQWGKFQFFDLGLGFLQIEEMVIYEV